MDYVNFREIDYRFQIESSEALLINDLTNEQVFKVTGVRNWLLKLELIEDNNNSKKIIPKVHVIDFNEELLKKLHPEYYV